MRLLDLGVREFGFLVRVEVVGCGAVEVMGMVCMVYALPKARCTMKMIYGVV